MRLFPLLLDGIPASNLLGLGLWGLIWGAVVYSLCLIIYRLTLHPLAKFPGPRMAAATHLFEIAHDFFGHGAYLFEIERMHDKYGEYHRTHRATCYLCLYFKVLSFVSIPVRYPFVILNSTKRCMSMAASGALKPLPLLVTVWTSIVSDRDPRSVRNNHRAYDPGL